MAAYLSLGSFILLTFLLVGSPYSSARDIPSDISLVQEPEESYYIVKKKPAVIVCQARNAADIIFTCMGTQIPPSSVEMEDISDIDPNLIQAKIEVTRADVQNSESAGTPFWCECSAVDINDEVVVTSRRTTINIAVLKSKFGLNPMSTTASEGENVEFACAPPEGDPTPEIMWRKDKKRIRLEENSHMLITDKGSLVIESVTEEDSGSYQCVAKNFAGRRESDEAVLTVKVLAEAAEAEVELQEQRGTETHRASGAGKPRVARQSTKAFFTSEPQESYYITPDKPLSIDCGVTAADILTYRCNGERMDRERQTIDQGMDNAGNRVIQSQLSISYADVEAFLARAGEGRTYQCQCVAWYQDSNNPRGWGHITSSQDVGVVLLAYLERTFQLEPKEVTAGLGTDAVMKCEPPKGQPAPWVYWFKDRTRLDPRSDNKYSINSRGHLTIHDVQYEDAGTYNCLAENTVDSVQSRLGRLIVTEDAPPTTMGAPVDEEEDFMPSFPDVIPDTPVFLRDFEARNTLGRDGTKTMVCAVVSAEQLSVDCGGQRLPPEAYELMTDVDSASGKRLLSAKTVVTSDSLARNPDDFFCQCTAWYLGNDRAWAMITSVKGYVEEGAQAAYIDDQFVYPPESLEVYFEDVAEFSCEPPAGNPEPKVYWMKGTERIDPVADPNFVVLEEGPLIIEYVRVKDEGTYTCVAENEAGVRASNPVQLTVLGKPTTLPEVTQPASRIPDTTVDYGTDYETDYELTEPLFSEEPMEFNYIVKDEPVRLHCTVVGSKTLLFVCNGEVLQESATTGFHTMDPISGHTIRDNHLTVTRDQVQAYTGGDSYSCVCRAFYEREGAAEGELDSVDSQPGVVKIAYLQRNFAKEPSDVQIKEGERAILPCEKPEGVPEPQVYWLKDGFRLIEDERVTVGEMGELSISEMYATDAGEYICVAENLVRQRTSSPARLSLYVGDGEPEPEGGVVDPDEGVVDPEPTHGVVVPEQPYGTPYISKDLHAVYYLIKNKPATITCEAHGVSRITFSCGMEDVEVKEMMERVDEVEGDDGQLKLVNIIEASIDVTKTDVENFYGSEDYWCQCYAHYEVPGMDDPQVLSSEKGYVQMAYLKKNFQKEPENKMVPEGSFLSIQCQPPIGNPEPKVSWTKDGEKVEALSITPDGALIFPEARMSHTGQYVCEAENVAGKRSSPPILVEVTAGGEGAEGMDTDFMEGGEAEEGVGEPEPTGEPESAVEIDEIEVAGEVTDEDTYGEPTGEHDAEADAELTGEPDEETDAEPEPAGELDGDAGAEPNGEPDGESDAEEAEAELTGEPDDGDYGEAEMNNVDEGYDVDEDGNDDRYVEVDRGDHSKAGPGAGGKRNENVCAQMLSTCSALIPQNVDQVQYCEAVPDYSACVDNFSKMCQGIINEDSMNAVKIAKMHAETKCHPSCPKLEDCKMIYSNSPDKTMDTTGLPVRNFCEDVSSFLRCVDQTLVDCNVTMAPPEEDVRTSLFEVGNWFTQYCNRMILGSDALANCEEMVSCDLGIGQVAPNNATYWCRLMSTLVECTAGAVNTCGLDELRNDLEILHAQANQDSCYDDMGGAHGGWPEGEPEPEGEGEPEPEGEGNDDDDDDDDDDDENLGGIEASKEGDPEDGASAVGASILLAVLSQLLVAAVLSRR